MKEFLLKNYSVITHSIELLAALTGLIFYKKYKSTAAKYFIYFLVYLTFFDTISGYTRYVHPERFLNFLIETVIEKNHWLTTIYWDIGAIMFFSFYYCKILETKLFIGVIKIMGYTFLVFSIVHIALNWGVFFMQFFDMISIFGALVIFLCTVFYFIETLQSDRVLTFYKSLNFYISFAILIWWLIITPITFYDIYFKYEIGQSYVDLNFVFLRFLIYLFANLFMYSTFTFALIFCKPENDSIEAFK